MITPEQSRAARALIGWTQTELAAASHLSMSTIRDFERGQRVPTVNNLAAIRRALEEAGIEILDGDEPGVKLRKRERTPASRRAGPGAVRTRGRSPDHQRGGLAMAEADDTDRPGPDKRYLSLREGTVKLARARLRAAGRLATGRA